jgi:hypothetical protein
MLRSLSLRPLPVSGLGALVVTRRSPLEGSSQNVLKNASAALAAMAEHPEVCGTQRMIAA